MSQLRAKCPDCLAHTAVALGPEYQCHSCGREFAAGLVRVPRAWGEGGDAMAEAATMPLPYPEAAVVAEPTLGEQTLALASEIPIRPLVLGGDCCAHVGAVEGLAARHGRLGVVWLDAHGDLHTSETSISGNAWGMPLRMIIDSGAVDPADVALVGARNLEDAEEEYVAANGVHVGVDGVEELLARIDCLYVALDADALDAAEVDPFMPEPGGLPVTEAERLLARIADRGSVLGAGVSGLTASERNVEPVTRLLAALL